MSGLPKPIFPDDVWDGTGPTYPSTTIDKPPDYRMGDQYAAEIIELEKILIDVIEILEILKNVGNANSILGVDDAGVDLEYKDLVAGTGITINHSTGQVEISSIGGGATGVVEMTNNEATTINIGQPVYVNMADGIKLAQGNASTKIKVLGLVSESFIPSGNTGNIQIYGVLEATTDEWDAVTDDKGGLVPNVFYYLETWPAGKLTSKAPTTSGHFVVRIGLAISPTKLSISVRPPIGLS
jgi:hypothetical protein